MNPWTVQTLVPLPVLVPLFAAGLEVAYVRRGRLYAEHFVFSLHVHAMAFALLTIAVFWTDTAARVGRPERPVALRENAFGALQIPPDVADRGRIDLEALQRVGTAAAADQRHAGIRAKRSASQSPIKFCTGSILSAPQCSIPPSRSKKTLSSRSGLFTA